MEAVVESHCFSRIWNCMTSSNSATSSSWNGVCRRRAGSLGRLKLGTKVRVPRCRIRAVSSEVKRDDDGDGWIVENAEMVRSFPLFVGGASFAAVLLNRAFSGIASIADASSAQSRADVLALALSASVVLTGLVWKSIQSRPQFPVALYGVECMRVASSLPTEVVREVTWAWESLENATRTRSMIVVYRNRCILQAGLAAEREDQGGPEFVDASRVLQGSLYKTLKESKKQSYLANLALYPDRFELPFLPPNTQALILQPLGEDGVLILGSDTLRGFGPNDQRWIVAIGEKLDSALADTV
ncbi:hypothetical protein R1flu_021308 [Riccia fluitans]|uniref:Protein COFACTOR ASSEMBLY OF COMPLEX C SUBUNIT B CCB4, chloroplastic n=1 Tax=Riccia fluitans TaxID=41844 RepID=A0ABD1ZQJ2_9MARC